jgi:hypothetical protein
MAARQVQNGDGQITLEGGMALVRGGGDLRRLALLPWKRFVVGHFKDDPGDVFAELLGTLPELRIGGIFRERQHPGGW